MTLNSFRIMIGWLVRNVVLKIHKPLIRLHRKYCTQSWALVSRQKLACNIDVGEYKKQNDKNKKKAFKITVLW